MRNLLSIAFQNQLQLFNNELFHNIRILGQFSLSFDIWTIKNQISYLNIIISYINVDFKLIYRLIGK